MKNGVKATPIHAKRITKKTFNTIGLFLKKDSLTSNVIKSIRGPNIKIKMSASNKSKYQPINLKYLETNPPSFNPGIMVRHKKI